MSDWNDEELANIQWGDGGEGDDHIVPYQAGMGFYNNGKEWCRTSNDSKPTMLIDTPVAEYDLHGRKTVEHSSRSGEKAGEIVKCHEKSQFTGESKEQGDFDDYSWDSIGSFDDIGRIFSNDEPMFGNVNLDGAEALWSTLESPEFGTYEPLNIKADHVQQDSRFPKLEINDSSPYGQQSRCTNLDHEEYQELTDMDIGGKTNEPTSSCKVDNGSAAKICAEENQQKELLKSLTNSEKSNDSLNPWTINSDDNLSVPLRSYMSSETPCQLQGSASSHYQDYMDISVPGNFANPYPATAVVCSAQPQENKNKSAKSSYNPMTPQEKIEKLRRRQQMQAMHAIQRQQQKYIHQNNDENMNVENKGSMLFDESSALVLGQLQEVVSKLDICTRLSIRNSLFRLAEAASERHHACETSNSLDEMVLATEDATKHYGQIQFTKQGYSVKETGTNPLDRTIAHLLFHSSLET